MCSHSLSAFFNPSLLSKLMFVNSIEVNVLNAQCTIWSGALLSGSACTFRWHCKIARVCLETGARLLNLYRWPGSAWFLSWSS